MPINITMPALSPTMEEGNLAKWLVKEGDKVAPGDVIAEIETDKATMEFEAVDEGTVLKILVPEGTDNVKVGAVIAVIGAEGEDASAVPASACRSVVFPRPFSPTIATRDAGVTTRSTWLSTGVTPRITETSEAVSCARWRAG